jgi:NIMA (never in mitosis gene a)-related kinase
MTTLLKQHGYAELKKIGEGSFGQAVLVVRVADKIKSVCKKMELVNASEEEKLDIIRESRLLSTLRHPYIVRYRDSFSNDRTLCLLMEYCDAGDLALRIVEQKKRHRELFREEQVLRWLTQALLGLKYVHEQKVIHRDIKPNNLFLVKGSCTNRNGATGHAMNLKIGDFGIAKSLESTQALASTCIGTPYYLAPEICEDKPYSWGSDIWAMGCVLFEVCSLHVPFDAQSLHSLMERICRGRLPNIPDAYSKDLRQVCNEMLTRDPLRRPSAALLVQTPVLQKCMMKLLREEQSLSAAVGDPSLSAAQAEIDVRRRSFNAGDARYRETAGTFQNGDQVEYRAEMGSDWLPATVMGVSAEGWIRIDLMPGLWLRQEDQATKVRPGKPKPSSAGNPTPKASNIMNSLLNDNVGFAMGSSVGFAMGSSLEVDSPSRKRGPSPSFFQGVESAPQKRRAANASPGPPLRRNMGYSELRSAGPGYSPNPIRKSKDELSNLGGIRMRSSLEPPKGTSMSRSPSCPGSVHVARIAGRHIIGA